MTAPARYSRFASRRWLVPSPWMVGLWAVVGLWGGCASRRQFEVLEAELRRHEDAMRAAATKTVQLERELVQARQETELLRSRLAATDSGAPLPEQTGHLVRLSGVKINTLLSGGKDRDGQPGDDVLVALISPHDQQGDLVKIETAGKHLDARQLNRELRATYETRFQEHLRERDASALPSPAPRQLPQT